MSDMNSEYYQHEMMVQRYVVMVEVDVEVREGDPTYAPAVLGTELLNSSVRLLDPQIKYAALVGTPRQVVDGR